MLRRARCLCTIRRRSISRRARPLRQAWHRAKNRSGARRGDPVSGEMDVGYTGGTSVLGAAGRQFENPLGDPKHADPLADRAPEHQARRRGARQTLRYSEPRQHDLDQYHLGPRACRSGCQAKQYQFATPWRLGSVHLKAVGCKIGASRKLSITREKQIAPGMEADVELARATYWVSIQTPPSTTAYFNPL